jgi:flagellar biosynthetic protein FlhB
VKRFALSQGGVETLKTLVAATAIAYFTWRAIEASIIDSARLPWMSPEGAAAVTWGHAETLLWRAAWTLGVLALADYAWQRYKMMSTLKMTRQEVRDEHKQAEGSGEVKGRMRRLQQQLSRRRMLRDVERATVVITNPTHVAVALEYRRETMVAPRVLAKGADHLAHRIRQAAIRHGVPIVENKPLARSLFASAEIGQTIPAQLFAAVAEVLAYLVRIKRLML